MDKFLGVFGIGLGEFHLVMDRTDYSAGESAKGIIRFTLKKPQKGKRLAVGVRATQKVTTRVQKPDGKTSTKKKTEKLHDFSYDLDGAKEYTQGEYPFELYLPPEIFDNAPSLPDNVLGDIGRIVSHFGAVQRSAIAWEVWAKLYIPWKNGPRRKKQLNVRRDAIPAPAARATCSACGARDHVTGAVFCGSCGNKI